MRRPLQCSDLITISKVFRRFSTLDQILIYNTHTERKDQEILDWFGPLNPTAKQADILSRRQPGTGIWMTEHEVFKEWLEGARNRLWCPGMRMYLTSCFMLTFNRIFKLINNRWCRKNCTDVCFTTQNVQKMES